MYELEEDNACFENKCFFRCGWVLVGVHTMMWERFEGIKQNVGIDNDTNTITDVTRVIGFILLFFLYSLIFIDRSHLE